MQKMKIILMFIFLFYAHAQGAQNESIPSFKKTKITYSPSGGTDQGDQAILEWNVDQKSCKARLPGSNQSKSIAFAQCETFYRDLTKEKEKFWKEFREHRSFRGMQMTIGPHVPLAELDVNGRKVGVRKFQKRICDENQHCSDEPFDQVDTFGEKIRQWVSEQLENKKTS